MRAEGVLPILLDAGDALVVEDDGDRIGAGPWARWLSSAVVPDESSARAERGRTLGRAGAVDSVTLGPGRIAARVTGSTGTLYAVAIDAPPVPARAWQETTRAARGRSGLAAAVEGRAQSVHLAHLMTTEHGASLAPSPAEVRRSCTCPDADYSGACKHVAAVAFAVADAIDRDPSLFLRWRGCEPVEAPAARSRDRWEAGPLPEPRPVRALPPGAVLKRLGRSGIRGAGVDLVEALAPAYAAFAATRREARNGA
ncbi:MAG TPA: SWIM zinc finger family protein [Gaiella sp.]|nr:SWIM zinc finger family protein [Gaiella sp.]